MNISGFWDNIAAHTDGSVYLLLLFIRKIAKRLAIAVISDWQALFLVLQPFHKQSSYRIEHRNNHHTYVCKNRQPHVGQSKRT